MSDYRTARHTALLVALMLKRSGKHRIRFSDKTLKRLSDRDRLRSAFIVEVQQESMNVGIVLVELNRGGFGAMWAKPLEGAETVTARNLLPRDERKSLTERKIIAELDLPSVEDEDDDED